MSVALASSYLPTFVGQQTIQCNYYPFAAAQAGYNTKTDLDI
jgi:hypothetical protein